ncbi:hypothetical protein [Hydromonas duriensis]|uniref:Uncharacterized protein n=1 Tax=Hydromonas duriensis TaxID=1527608 RepID=A0A4R6YBR8_9BURK|nr:hypothetical protein [Hydromonas duriensis]TDR33008.1 hypothetical protein DFR44_10157 [Hydromonas duriensis]
MKHTKLLNLWPTPESVRLNLQKRLWAEWCLTVAVVALCVCSAWLYVHWRISQTTLVNDMLTQEIAQMQAQAGASTSNEAQQWSDWRYRHAGQLDWMVRLAEASSAEVSFLNAKQTDDKLTLVGQTTNPTFAKNALNLFAEHTKRYPQLKLTQFEQKTEKGQTRWLFSAELETVKEDTPNRTKVVMQ